MKNTHYKFIEEGFWEDDYSYTYNERYRLTEDSPQLDGLGTIYHWYRIPEKISEHLGCVFDLDAEGYEEVINMFLRDNNITYEIVNPHSSPYPELGNEDEEETLHIYTL